MLRVSSNVRHLTACYKRCSRQDETGIAAEFQRMYCTESVDRSELGKEEVMLRVRHNFYRQNVLAVVV